MGLGDNVAPPNLILIPSLYWLKIYAIMVFFIFTNAYNSLPMYIMVYQRLPISCSIIHIIYHHFLSFPIVCQLILDKWKHLTRINAEQLFLLLGWNQALNIFRYSLISVAVEDNGARQTSKALICLPTHLPFVLWGSRVDGKYLPSRLMSVQVNFWLKIEMQLKWRKW